MTGGGDDMVLPLAAMNPMGKAHVAELLDVLIDLDAEGAAAEAVAEGCERLHPVGASLQVGLVVADDAQGGWTDRNLFEAKHRFEGLGEARRGWVPVLCWTGEAPDLVVIRRRTLAAIYWTLFLLRFGRPTSLAQMMRQEGLAAAFAGAKPILTEGVLELARTTLVGLRERREFPVTFTALYGDTVADSVGLPPLGLPPRAGFEVALAEVLQEGVMPEAVLAAE